MSDLDGWKIAQGIGWAFMGLLSWLGIRVMNRQDATNGDIAALQKNCVTRDEFLAALDARHQENKEEGRERGAALRRIEDKIDAAQLGALAVRLDRAEQDIQDLRTWKHNVDPFIERKVIP